MNTLHLIKDEKMNLEKIHLFFKNLRSRIGLSNREKVLDELSYYAEIGRISSGIFHDLMSPISSISLLLEDNKNISKEKYDKYLKESNKELRKFILALNEYLINQDVIEEFSVNEKVESVMKLINYKSIKNNINLNIISESSLKLYGNPIKFQQMILNLISNSIDSYIDCPRDKNTVSISIFENAENIFIKVKDFGCGISKDVQEKMFNLYETTKEHGTGVGLYTTKRIVEKDFNGKIEVESEESEGSCFTVTLRK